MAKTIGLLQLSQKVYDIVQLSDRFKNFIGEIESSFDAIIYGDSGNGKSSFTVELMTELVEKIDCVCEYVAYEEGQGKTMQDLMIHRNDLLKRLGNKVRLTDHLTYDELHKRMGRKQSPKIWIMDSIQLAMFTDAQVVKLKRDYVNSRKKKIIIYISWSDGLKPKGSVAKAIEYNCNIKMRVQNFVVFPKSRYGGNKPYIIWEEKAKIKWGEDYDHKVLELPKGKKKPKPKKPKQMQMSVVDASTEPVTKMKISEPAEKPLFND